MELKGLSFIEDWKVGFKAFGIDTKKFKTILDSRKDGYLFI